MTSRRDRDRERILSVYPYADAEELERRVRQEASWRRRDRRKVAAACLVIAAFVGISVMQSNYTPPAAESASDACESWRYFPKAKTYQEADVRDRMLTLSRAAAQGDARWAPLAAAIERDRPSHLLGAPPGELDDDYIGPTQAGIAARNANRKAIEAECRVADQEAQEAAAAR